MVQTPDNIAYVCPSFAEVVPHHEFNDLQSAIDWVPDYGNVKIVLYDNLLGIPELVLTNRNTNITIDGLNQYGITFAGGSSGRIVEVGESQFLKFRNMTYIRGGMVQMRSDGANFGIYDTQSAMMYIEFAMGMNNNIYIHDSKFYGADGYYGIDVGNSDGGIEILNSFVQGAPGRPLIMFRADSDKKLLMKNSTILHGQPDVTFPIQQSGSFEVGVRIHNCSSNSRICNDEINNWIVNNNNNIGDIEIVF